MSSALLNGECTPEPDLSLVIPVYRSEDCLRPVMEAIAQALVPARLTYEVILVNDCSPDQSWKVIEGLCQDHANVRGVDLRRNFGQDNAIITGLRFARGKYVVIMDDDFQHHPRDIPALLHKLQEDRADVGRAESTSPEPKPGTMVANHMHRPPPTQKSACQRGLTAPGPSQHQPAGMRFSRW